MQVRKGGSELWKVIGFDAEPMLFRSLNLGLTKARERADRPVRCLLLDLFECDPADPFRSNRFRTAGASAAGKLACSMVGRLPCPAASACGCREGQFGAEYPRWSR
jgi:hypothetical protein